MDSDKIYIDDLAKKLGRAPHTIRQWLKRKDFPRELKPSREGGREKIFWLPSQLSGLESYAQERMNNRGSFGRTEPGPAVADLDLG